MTARAFSGAAIVAVIALAYVGFGAFVGGGYDPGRDVAVAFAIAHDGARPLLGPMIAGQAHLGPIWYYVLALPMLIAPTWLTAAMTAVVLGALQFPLAYATGKRLGDRTLGVLWAVALAMPGWASFETVGFASTNVVRTLVLATIYCVLRARDPSPRRASPGWWFAAGLAAAAATHAHPSSAWLAAIVLICAWRRPGRVATHVRDEVAAVLAVAAGAAVLFIPALMAPASLVASTRAVAEGNIAMANLARIPALLWSVTWSGPHAIMAAVYLPGRAFAGNMATVSALLGLVGVLRGVGAAVGGHRAARWAVVLVLVSVAFVALVRPVTPVYMAYSIIPGYALLVACGWRAWARRLPLAWFVVPALVAASVAGIGVVHAMRQGGGRVDALQLSNITHVASATPIATDNWLPAIGVDPLGRALCADPMPVYGALAYVLDVFYTMPVRMHCAAQLRQFTDESPAGTAHGRLGLALRRYRDLGAEPAARYGGLGLDPIARIVAAPPHRDLPIDATYPPHPYEGGAPARMAFTFDAPAAELVVVSNPRATWMPDWQSDAQCNGAPLAPATQDLVTRVYRCASGGVGNHWQVGVAAADPRALEVVTFTPRMR